MFHKNIARKEGFAKLPRSVITGEASLAHTGAIVDDQSLNFVTHLVLLSLKEWRWDQLEWMM